jgi:hypothetical protein
MRITDVDASAANPSRAVPATLSGVAARVYVGSIPLGKTIDGLFGDWATVAPDALDLVPPSVDLRHSASALQGGAFFYVDTTGDLMAGAVLPERRVPYPPSGGPAPGGPPVPIPRRAGEDVLRIYVDTDDRDTVGLAIGNMFADRLMEIRGRVGRITARDLFSWNPTTRDWQIASGYTLDVAFVGSQFEASIQAGFLGTLNNASVLFAMSDWTGRGDATDASGLRGGTRGGPGIVPLHGTNAETILATPLTNVPVIDGNCATTGTEYAGASTDTNANLTFSIGRRSDSQFLYVCVEVTIDTTNNTLDWGSLLFDRNHNGGASPQTDDRRFEVLSNSTALKSQEGDGVGWIDCTSCDAGNAAEGNFSGTDQVYEFKIRFSDVWGTNNPSANQVAGFAIVAHDEDVSVDYAWGSDNVDQDVPDTWGHLEIPEFSIGIAAPALILLILVAGRRRRRTRPPTLK